MLGANTGKSHRSQDEIHQGTLAARRAMSPGLPTTEWTHPKSQAMSLRPPRHPPRTEGERGSPVLRALPHSWWLSRGSGDSLTAQRKGRLPPWVGRSSRSGNSYNSSILLRICEGNRLYTTLLIYALLISETLSFIHSFKL